MSKLLLYRDLPFLLSRDRRGRSLSLSLDKTYLHVTESTALLDSEDKTGRYIKH